MRNTLSSMVLAWAIATSVGNPVYWEDTRSQAIDKKREVIITSVNNLIRQKWITLQPGEKCVITVFGKQKELQAILACNGTKKWDHTSTLKNWERYLTQIFDIPTTKEWFLDAKQWCIIMQVPWYEDIQWKQCNENQEAPDNWIQPLKRYTNGDYI